MTEASDTYVEQHILSMYVAKNVKGVWRSIVTYKLLRLQECLRFCYGIFMHICRALSQSAYDKLHRLRDQLSSLRSKIQHMIGLLCLCCICRQHLLLTAAVANSAVAVANSVGVSAYDDDKRGYVLRLCLFVCYW